MGLLTELFGKPAAVNGVVGDSPRVAGVVPFSDAGPDLSGLGDLLSLSRQEVLDALFDAALDSFDLALPDAAFGAPDQPRVPAGSPEGGEWTSGGGAGDVGETTARWEKEDRQRERRQEKEAEALEERQQQEWSALSDARDREDAATEKHRGKEDSVIERQRDREEAREEAKSERAAQRAKDREDAASFAREKATPTYREWVRLDREYGPGSKESQEAWQRHEDATGRNAEDARLQKVHGQIDRNAEEYMDEWRAGREKVYAEEDAARKQARAAEDAATAARRDAEDEPVRARHEQETQDLAARHEAEDAEVYARRRADHPAAHAAHYDTGDAPFYSPDQPRVPAGSPGGGEWGSGGGGPSVSPVPPAALARYHHSLLVYIADNGPAPASELAGHLGDRHRLGAAKAKAVVEHLAKQGDLARGTDEYGRAVLAPRGHGVTPPPPAGAAGDPERRVLDFAAGAGGHPGGLAPVWELSRQLGLPPDEFKALLFRLRREGKIRLVAVGDQSRLTHEQLRDSVQGENERFAYVEPGPDHPAAAFSLDAPFYSPGQPRVPAGSPDGGRWSGGVAPGTAAARGAASDAVRDFARGQGTPTSAEVQALAGHLARLTVAQIHALKAEHGLKGSAPNKAALVAKLAQRFRAHRGANPVAEPAAAAGKGEPTHFHATYAAVVPDILRDGLRPSSGGTAGPGVYLSDSFEHSLYERRPDALGVKTHGGQPDTVIGLRVKGKLWDAGRQGHGESQWGVYYRPNQKAAKELFGDMGLAHREGELAAKMKEAGYVGLKWEFSDGRTGTLVFDPKDVEVVGARSKSEGGWKAARAAPPPPAPPPPPRADLGAAVETFARTWDREKRTEVPFEAIYAHLKGLEPSFTPDDFKALLLRLKGEGRIRLSTFSGPKDRIPDRRLEMPHEGGEGRVFYHVYLPGR